MACVTSQHKLFLSYLNALRSQHGLPPLHVSAILHDAAAKKASQLAVLPASFWNGDPHTIDGVTARELVLDHGYPETAATGENLLYGVDTASEAYDIWDGSTPHRDNMLTPYYTEVGIAGPIGGPWQHPGDAFEVWVTEFGSARTAPAQACEGPSPVPAPVPRPKPKPPTLPAKPPPRQERQRRRRWKRLLRRIFGR